MFASRSGAPPVHRVGPYRLLHRLGEGGMGVVHLAEGPDGNRLALKVLRPHVVGDDEARERLAREVKSLSRVRSPRVAEILDSDPWGPIPYVATRYVPGLSLHDHVPQAGPLVGADLARFACGLAEALQAVHRVGVLHRDIKPSNVLMEGRNPVLIDFGLARVVDDDRLTRTGWLLGTPGYLAPEILYGHEPTAAADVHSWAATVAFAGTGRPPFGRGPSVAVMDRVRRGEHDLFGLDESVAWIIHVALDPDPTRRPTLPEVIQQLGGTVTSPRIPVTEPPTLPLPQEPTRPTPTQPAPPQPAPVMPPSNQPYQTPPPADWGPPKTPPAERFRRWLLGLGLLAVVAGGVATAPYVAGAAVAGSVIVLRWLSVTASSASDRRRLRGAKWYDGILTLFSTPVHLIASLPGTLLLLIWTAILMASAALMCVAGKLTPEEALPGLGVLLGLVLWTGPGASRVRSPIGRVGAPLARKTWPWLITFACLVGLAAGMLWAVQDVGINWSPVDGGPLRSGTWLGRHL